jgi:hypothetical protein
MKKILILAVTLLSFPGIIFAANISDLTDLLDAMRQIMNAFVPLLFGLAMLAFLWGMVKYIYKADKADARKEGRNMMIYSVVAFAVMLSIWGLALFLKNSFFAGSPSPVNINGSTGTDAGGTSGNGNPFDDTTA